MAQSRRSELLMFYGGPGVGKTLGAMRTVQAHPSQIFHYLEADRILDPVLEWFDEPLYNLERYPAFQFDQFIESKDKIITDIRNAEHPEDHWVIIDTIGYCYREIQNVWALRMHGVMADALKEKRIGQKDFSFDGFSGKEWPFIKRTFYAEFLCPLVQYNRNNAIIIAHSKSTNDRFSPQSPTEYTDRFEKLGQIPDVHKDVINYVHTCLYFDNVEKDKFRIRTLKESGRRKWIDISEPLAVNDFWIDYSGYVG